MLTIKDINEVSFGKAGFSGYNPEDVDNFIDQVAASFQQLMAERDAALQQVAELTAKNSEVSGKISDMREKLAILAEKVEAYRKEEDGIKDALISAQRLARDSVQEAKDKASIILEDAKNSAQKMLDAAKIEASKAAKEYMEQAEAKKAELEEIKRQVSAFRVSLLEMYKKHLECINKIPNFRQKDKEEERETAEGSASTVTQASKVPAPQSETQSGEPPAAVEHNEGAVTQESVYEQDIQPEVFEEQAPVEYYEESVHTLQDKVDYTQQSVSGDSPLEEQYMDDDLSDVGIDLKTYSSIPETLRQEKSNHFTNLEFGDDVELSNKKHKK